MDNYSRFLAKPMAITTIALGQLLSVGLHAQTTAQSASERVSSAAVKSAALSDYLNGLGAAVQDEQRSTTWATKKESELLASYSAKEGLPINGLKSLECRSSKCDLQLQLDMAESPRSAMEQQVAVNRWIADSQACGFTISSKPGSQATPGTVRIILDCGK